MPTQEEFKARHPALTLMLNGHFGSGKTRAAMTFPKVYAIGCDPSGLDILYQKPNDALMNNLVHVEYLHNENEAELKKLFRENAKAEERDALSGCMAHVKALAADKQIETLLIDGFTYLVDMKWQHINEFEAARGASGNVDSQTMYRNLGLYLQRFVSSDLLTMATRLGLNVVLTCHLKREGEATIKGTMDTRTKMQGAGRVNQLSDIAPLIEGGFRQKAEGLVGASIYLDDKLMQDGTKKYFAYCDKISALNTIVLAKNRYNLPAKVDITNKSLYDVIHQAIKGELKAAPAPAAK